MSFNVGSAVGYLLLDASGWTKGLTSAKQALSTFLDKSSTLTDKIGAVGSSLRGLGTGLTTTVTAPLLGLGAAAVKTAATFEQSMAQVQATLGISKDAMSELNGESVNTMEALSDLAKEMGASTKFSATEAAEAINNMAMAGYKVQEIYDTLPQVLNLASAGTLDLDYATQLVANGLNVMGLGTEKAAEMADKLAVTASNAYGSVSDFGEGLLVAGAQAKLANVSLTDTFTALGILGDNGISAHEGGTYLRNTLKNLYTPTEDAAKALDKLKVETRNTDGSVRDFQSVLQDLKSALDGLSEGDRLTYMSRIFDTRTISAANALIQNSGQRFDELSEKIENSAGAAKEMADTQLNTLEGKITILKSALEGLSISFGELLVPLLTQFVEKITAVVDKLNSLDESTKETILRVAAFAAAFGPVMLILGNILGVIAKLSTMFSTISQVIGGFNGTLAVTEGLAAKFGAAIAGVMAPMLAIVTAVVALVAAFKHLWETNEKFREKIISIWGTIKETFDDFFSSLTEKINEIGFDFENFTQVVSAIWEKFTQLLGPVFIGVFNQVSITVRTVLDLILNILDVFIGLFTGNWEQLWSGVVGIFDTIIMGIGLTIENTLRILSNFVNVIFGWFGTSWQALWNTSVQWFQGFVDGIVQGFQSVVNWFTQLPGVIGGAVSQAIESVTDFGKSVWDSMVTGVSEAIDAVGEWFAKLPETIAYNIGFAYGYITEWSKNTYETLVAEIPKAVEAVGQWFAKLPLVIAGGLLLAVVSVRDWAVSMAQAFQQWWDGLVTSLDTWLKSIPEKFKSWFDQTTNEVVQWGVSVKDSASQATKGFVDGIVEWLKGIPDAFMEWLGQAIDWIKSLPETLYELGANMLKALWEGMKSIVTGIFDWIGELIDKIVGAFTGGVQEGINTAQANASKVSGSYATGLDYAPRDMTVQIHEGERILTKEENRNFSSNPPYEGPSSLSFNLSIPIDGEVISKKTYTYDLREKVLRGEDLVEEGVIQ